MNWDAIAAIGEIVGAFAVVVSIGYLSIQIRSNTRAMKASGGFDATHSWADINQAAVNWDPKMKSNMVRAMATDSRWDDFAAEDRFDITLAHRALFQKLEGQYFLYKYDFLEHGLWKKRGAWAASLIKLPFFKEWWRQEKQQHVYTDEFVTAVESIEVFDMRAAGFDGGAK
jgi:hypothetical protein